MGMTMSILKISVLSAFTPAVLFFYIDISFSFMHVLSEKAISQYLVMIMK